MRKLLLLAVLLVAGSASAQVIGPDGSWAVFVSDRSTSATLGALNAAATLQFTGRQGVGIQITTANLNATVTPEVSFDGGTTWLASSFVSIGGTVSATIVFSGGADTQQRSIVVIGGVSHVRVRVSAYTSGTSTAVIRNTMSAGLMLNVGSTSVTQGTSPWVVSGTVTTTPPANASTNVAQFGGTNVSTGTGAGGAGIPRVTVSNDSSLAANQSVNLTQVASTNTVTGGTAGSLGVGGTVAHDAVGTSVNPLLEGGYASAAAPADVSADGDAVRAWNLRNGARAIQPTFAGVLQSTGNGTAGTGTPRVTIASDNTSFAVNAAATQVTSPWVVSGTVTTTPPSNASTNVAQFGGTNVSTGTGASGAGIPRVTVANDSNILATQSTSPWVTRDDSSLVDNAGFTDGTSRVLPAGFFFDDVSVTPLAENDIGAARVTATRAQVMTIEDDGTRGQRTAVRAGQGTTTQVRPELAQNSLVTSISPNNSGLPVNLPVKVQTRASSSTGSVGSLALAFTSNNTAGNSIVVVCGVGVVNNPTMADTAGNTYTRAVTSTIPAPAVHIFYAVNIAAGANTVTCTNTGAASSMAISLYEISGLITNSATSQPGVAGAANATSTTAATSPISPTASNEWAIAGVVLGTAAQTITPATGWTNDSGQLNPTTPSGLFSMVAMSQYLESLLPSITPQATFTSEPWALAVATFKVPSVAVGGSVHLVFGGPQDASTGQAGAGTATGLPLVAATDAGWASAAPSLTGTTFPGAAAIGQFDDTSPGAVTENQWGFLRMSSRRELYGQLRDAAGNERGVNVSAGNALKVGIVGNADAAFDAANNAAEPANVLSVGVETIAAGSQPTAATGGNIRRALASTEGAVYVQEGNSNRFSCFMNNVTATTQCQAAPGAGLRAYVTSAHFSNESATAVTLDIVFGTGAACVTGTTALTHKWQMGTNATTTSPQSLEASFNTPLVPTAANAICVRPVGAGAWGATLTGFIAP